MAAGQDRATAERKSAREWVVTRRFKAPAALVFEAWSRAELFRQWWVPASFGMTLLSCEIDARTGGTYRLVFSHPDLDQPMAFHGRYIEVIPDTRLVWTNEEGGEDGAVSTVTFETVDGETLVVLRDLYPSREALDEAIDDGSTGGAVEQFEELARLLGVLMRR
jgi:hypothetical protein